LSKYPDGTIRLSPLFDFAPMRLAKEGIVRSTRWVSMRDAGLDHSPDWKRICAEVWPDGDVQAKLIVELRAFAQRLRLAPSHAKELGAPDVIIERAMMRCSEIADSVEVAFSKPEGA
jgi:serine/threonine-protein kinase HipA